MTLLGDQHSSVKNVIGQKAGTRYKNATPLPVGDKLKTIVTWNDDRYDFYPDSRVYPYTAATSRKQFCTFGRQGHKLAPSATSHPRTNLSVIKVYANKV